MCTRFNALAGSMLRDTNQTHPDVVFSRWFCLFVIMLSCVLFFTGCMQWVQAGAALRLQNLNKLSLGRILIHSNIEFVN